MSEPSAVPTTDGPRCPVRPLLRSLLLFAIGMVVFSCGRLALWLLNYADFSAVSAGNLAWAFWHGMRFDLSMWLMVAGGPLILLQTPGAWARRWWWQGVWGWLAFIGLALCAVLMGAGAVYFSYVHRHIGREILSFANDPAIALSSLGEHALPLAIAIAALIALGWCWQRFLRMDVGSKPSLVGVSMLLVCIGLMVLGIRGSLVSKPLAPITAFLDVPPVVGQLTLNTPFVLAKTVLKRSATVPHLLPDEEAARLYVREIGSEVDQLPDPTWPLAREHQPPVSAAPTPDQPANVVILLLESWGAQHVDALRRRRGDEPRGLTPELDRLAREGWLFDRFYANGQRSMQGIAALLAGITTPPGLPFLGEGLDLVRLRWLGQLAQRNGYQTFFMQGSMRSSFRVDAISRLAGFSRYEGAEDIPFADGEPEVRNPNGAHDGDLLAHLVTRADATSEPFMGLAFTLSTHGPFHLPGGRWKRPESGPWMERYFAALAYSDWAVGRCIDEARARPWGRRSWFVIMADHIGGVDAQDATPDMLHRIPLLIIPPEGEHPDLPPRGTVIDTLGSQVDVTPTLMDLLNWRGAFGGIGRSLFASGAQRSAWCVRGEMTTLITDQGWVLHQDGQRLEGQGDLAAQDDASRRIMALQQIVTGALVQDRAVPP